MNPRVTQALRLFWSFMLGSGLSSLVTFIAMPVYTRLLSPEQFGYFDLGQTLGTIVAALLYADVWVGVMRLSMRDSDPRPWWRAGLGLFALASVVLGLVALGVWAVARPDHIWLIALAVLMKSAATFWGFAARGAGLVSLFAGTGVVNAISTLVVSVALLHFSSLGAGALFLGLSAGCALQVAIIEARLGVVRRAMAGPGPVWSSELARFTLPLGINSVAFWLFTSAGRVVVANELGLAESGIFAAASKLGGLVAVVSGVVTLVWQQISFQGEAKDSRFYGRGTSIAALLYGGGGALAVPLGVWFYILTVDERYLAGWVTVPGFLLVAVLAGYSNFVGNIFYSLERTSGLFVSTVVCLGVVALLTVPLVRWHGINGANMALILGYGANISARHFILARYQRVFLPVSNVMIGVAGVIASAIPVLSLGILPGLCVALGFVVAFGWWTRSRGDGLPVVPRSDGN